MASSGQVRRHGVARMTRRWRRLAVWLLALGMVGAGVAMWGDDALRVLSNRDELTELVGRAGGWAPVVIILGQILQVVFAPIPGQIVGLVAGYSFGVMWGTVYCTVGSVLGTGLALWLSRRFGRPLVERLASTELIDRVDRYAEERGALAFFVIFLVPFLPDDLCCFVAGLTRIRISELLIVAMVGRMPGLVASTFIGSRARELSTSELVIVAGVSVLLAAGFARYQKPIEAAVFRLLDRLPLQFGGSAEESGE